MTAPDAARDETVAESERVALELLLQVRFDEDDACDAAMDVIGAGWRPPTEVAALVEAARAEERERIAAAVRVKRDAVLAQPVAEDGRGFYARGVLYAYDVAANIARDTR